MTQETMSSHSAAGKSGWSDDHPVLTVFVTIGIAVATISIVTACVIWILGS